MYKSGLFATTAWWLTCLGALPFVGLTWGLIVLPHVPSLAWDALTGYAAIILAFLGGIQWGRGLIMERPVRLIVAVLPALYAWGAMLAPWPISLVLLTLGFALLLLLDLRDSALPDHYRRLRLIITFVVVTHLTAAIWLAPSPAESPPSSTLFSEAHVMDKNVLDTALQLCSTNPRTGFYRNGRCETGDDDRGTHTVCAVVTEAFLDFTLQRGNDLITPRPDYNFPGLNPGDRWCLCALRWDEARKAGVAPPVVLEATHKHSLDLVDRDELIKHALSQGAP